MNPFFGFAGRSRSFIFRTESWCFQWYPISINSGAPIKVFIVEFPDENFFYDLDDNN